METLALTIALTNLYQHHKRAAQNPSANTSDPEWQYRRVAFLALGETLDDLALLSLFQ